MCSGAPAGQVWAAGEAGQLPGTLGDSGGRPGAGCTGATFSGGKADPEPVWGREREDQTEAWT